MWIATKIGFFEFNVSCGNVRVTAQTQQELENFAKLAGEALGREIKVFHAARTIPSYEAEPRFPTERKVILETAELGLVLNLLAYTVDYHDFLETLKDREELDEYYVLAFSHFEYLRRIRESRNQALQRLKENRIRKNELEYKKQKLGEEFRRACYEEQAMVRKRQETLQEIRKIESKLESMNAKKTGAPNNGESVFGVFWKSIFGGQDS
ncbi:MAG: hypothetical protein EBV83_04370 [Verrucomicrobia bacterium]|nr:hypothetical protein [Verrucomicrobiota bacterium]